MTKGKFFQNASKTLTKTFGVVLSLATGVLNGIDEYNNRMKKYTADGIPEDIAKHDAFIDAFATFAHDNLSSYFKGIDDWVFKFMLSVVGGETDKNYIEVIGDRFKTLKYKNTGSSGDDPILLSTDNKSYLYGNSGTDSILLLGAADKKIYINGNVFNENPYSSGTSMPIKFPFLPKVPKSPLINDTSGNDEIYNYRSNVLINADKGNDTIYNGGSYGYSWIYGGTQVTINGGKGNDYIYNLSGYKVSISAGDSDDYIYNFGGDSATINGNSSNDSVYNRDEYHSSINTGSGNDIIYNYWSSDVTIDSGEGNDLIYNDNGSEVFILAGDGDDYVETFGGDETIDAGAGDGKDVIFGFDSKDILTFDNIEFKTSYSAKNKAVTFKVDGGSVTLKDFTAKTFQINNDVYKISGSKFVKK